MIFISVSKYQPYKSWIFIYYMCAYLVQITVVKCDAQPSNDVNYFKMFCVIVTMLIGQLQALLIKYNPNTMLVIYMCLQRVLHWNISVQYHSQISSHLKYQVSVMQYFTLFYLTIEIWILPLLPYTANDLFHCLRKKTY